MTDLKLVYLVILALGLLTEARAAAGPVALYPLNAKYATREINNRQPPGKAVGVTLAPGPDGQPGGSYQFAGNADSYIEFPNDGGLDVKHSITMLCWVYPESLDGPLFQYFTTNIKYWGTQMWLILQSQLHLRVVRRENYEYTAALVGPSITLNQWHYVGSTYDYNTGIARLYVDGQMVKELRLDPNIDLATQDDVRMGATPNENRFFKGRITAMQVYDVALTSEQINDVEEDGLGGKDICEEEKPCKNGAECENSGDSYTCKCAEGFQGPTCESVDKCAANSVVCYNGGTCQNEGDGYKCHCLSNFVGEHCEWEKQGCYKEVKSKKKKAMAVVFAKFRKYKKDIPGAVEACMKAAEKKKLKIFGIRNRYTCATTKGDADFERHGSSDSCKGKGAYVVGGKRSNYVYVLKKEA